MGILIDNRTGDTVFETDDPERMSMEAGEREGAARNDGTTGPVFSVEGFDSGELESGEVRGDAPHDIPVAPPEDVVEDIQGD